jgi:hypothetical protein
LGQERMLCYEVFVFATRTLKPVKDGTQMGGPYMVTLAVINKLTDWKRQTLLQNLCVKFNIQTDTYENFTDLLAV